MVTIEFEKQGDKYVYQYTSNGAHRTIQTKHPYAVREPLSVYARIDESLPWSHLGSSEAHNAVTAIVTVGVPAGIQVKIVSNVNPSVAGYIDAQ